MKKITLTACLFVLAAFLGTAGAQTQEYMQK